MLRHEQRQCFVSTCFQKLPCYHKVCYIFHVFQVLNTFRVENQFHSTHFLWCLRGNPWKVANLGSRSPSYSTIINSWRSWMNLLCLTWCQQDRRGDVPESTDKLKTPKKIGALDPMWRSMYWGWVWKVLKVMVFFLDWVFLLGTKAIPDLVTNIFVHIFLQVGK